ncbi:nicotinamide-nucleotide amidohydrolase family protein [Cryobacterium sp. Sr8]|uniref:Competence/damage-inducible protein cinA n=1 Tax=Cryobacterium psychrotolerans TaxID=386301 RepID=A0A1G9EHY4_9MICO|nr:MULTISPECIES: nicotinamide-nucleotide amidohydrolase family protein [Cryobacterium]TFD40715.1 nicotinamide-nucleotide amidohydrolase family protein [Cryobacterium sp. TMT1-2-1]TFD82072.1 nicotinamide-nucleotide amidohydrolase family protein [Cryobacterium sp. Sr8]TFD88471.1 nicotinamide-nucleotide amidohydrolase family protein [Cryobacterium psychrotolerans]SDK75671.1 competence/damage-inducible protein cinA [Cryobacterium psychrotolerans]
MPDLPAAGPASPQARDADSADAAALLIAELTARHLTIAVAESLTGGLLVAELVRIPGASVVVNGGVVAYQTELKHRLLAVDSSILNVHGPVHPDVAMQMAIGVRTHLAVGGERADIGVSTTGVAGPDATEGHAPGTVYIGLSQGSGSWVIPLRLAGDRDAVRAQAVVRAVQAVRELLGRDPSE